MCDKTATTSQVQISLTKLDTTNNNITDFPIRTSAVPREEWPLVDAQNCLDQGRAEYPKEGSLERRMPYAIVIGTMKSGSSALSLYLYQHPNVVRPHKKELHYFDFSFSVESDGIHRNDARRNYRKAFEEALGDDGMELLESSEKMVALDDSPLYMLWSERIPARILCVSPWTKLLAILRNPIDRAYSHYNMKLNSRGAKNLGNVRLPTFEEWIEMDFRLLKETGVIQDSIPLEQFGGSKEELQAWKDYTRRGSHCPIGRGLYAIQLRHWFQAYESAGKNISDTFFIIQSEKMKSDSVGIYNQVLEFLELPPFEVEEFKERNKGQYKQKMKNETREILQEFFKPYNQELYKLLGKEWEGAWDP